MGRYLRILVAFVATIAAFSALISPAAAAKPDKGGGRGGDAVIEVDFACGDRMILVKSVTTADGGDAHPISNIVILADGSELRIEAPFVDVKDFDYTIDPDDYGEDITAVYVKAGRNGKKGYGERFDIDLDGTCDADGDGFDTDTNGGNDCDDSDAEINPDAAEVPYDGFDNDCSNGDLNDVDGDGHAADMAVGGTPDCNDDDPLTYPGAVDDTVDGTDQDCDGRDGIEPGLFETVVFWDCSAGDGVATFSVSFVPMPGPRPVEYEISLDGVIVGTGFVGPDEPLASFMVDGLADGSHSYVLSNLTTGFEGPPGEFDIACDIDSDVDSDSDGLADSLEIEFGTDPFDADSDDDGVLDGSELLWNIDSDENWDNHSNLSDGGINALDPDSDNDSLPDGLELGLDCSHPDTDPSGPCRADQDGGTTTTDPLNANSDNGSDTSAWDGREDLNANGIVEYHLFEHDPNDPSDDIPSPEICGDGIDNNWNLQIDERCI